MMYSIAILASVVGLIGFGMYTQGKYPEIWLIPFAGMVWFAIYDVKKLKREKAELEDSVKKLKTQLERFEGSEARLEVEQVHHNIEELIKPDKKV